MMKASSCSVSAWRARLRSCTSVPSPNSWASRLGVATCFILKNVPNPSASSLAVPHPEERSPARRPRPTCGAARLEGWAPSEISTIGPSFETPRFARLLRMRRNSLARVTQAVEQRRAAGIDAARSQRGELGAEPGPTGRDLVRARMVHVVAAPMRQRLVRSPVPARRDRNVAQRTAAGALPLERPGIEGPIEGPAVRQVPAMAAGLDRILAGEIEREVEDRDVALRVAGDDLDGDRIRHRHAAGSGPGDA